ncbi:hypothetical protein GBA65_21960 (plasmid) [Rubrobacter marinus]|uniref:Uncharacterized protein n=1 Tax=Rubrobacter marinus TaxID=2653852 RepID=A0A6G8Q3Q7_9ACTN|nr:hypothetical protein [Rubrobacter marinus]QIN81102.1 hypothetical protein GBA65_21960 [Rubrobacter marinus]
MRERANHHRYDDVVGGIEPMNPKLTPEDLAVQAFGPGAADFGAGWRANTIQARRTMRRSFLDADQLRLIDELGLMVGVLADDVEALREDLAAAAAGERAVLGYMHGEKPSREGTGAGEEILVVRRPAGYWARFAAGRTRREMLERFGTDELSLPFGFGADPGYALNDVRRRNPGAAVELTEEATDR